ncbi:hypothetical protein K458DRAFT_396334 [Lentithecium fluviatile CBS 122367]|uniref:Uncharacterized protein n=1 Tax=Lentithecium fluviatile CBS 122367 TaxID=1168545 RepID=A0A6G1IFS1_9PLEO|nr:hypothetical protein K458DRAFT_396334 [Lentithecium fluviatile CBS 122367]
MNIVMDPPPSHSRSLSASSAHSGNSLFPPPPHYNYNVPKSPSALSTRSNRSPPFPGMGLPSSPRPSEPRSPMSPPMSARSFGTFIDSEPSTPAYSPRMGSTWDNSTLVLLSPVSSVSSTQGEPAWQMMPPIQKPPKRMTRHKVHPPLTKEVSLGAALASFPVTPVTPELATEDTAATKEVEEDVEAEKKAEEEQKTQAAPRRERLTARMKSLLRRRTENNNKKKAEKKKAYIELDRVETVHWTEL